MALCVKHGHESSSREQAMTEAGGEELVTPKWERDARVMVAATTMDQSSIRGLVTGMTSLPRGAASV